MNSREQSHGRLAGGRSQTVRRRGVPACSRHGCRALPRVRHLRRVARGNPAPADRPGGDCRGDPSQQPRASASARGHHHTTTEPLCTTTISPQPVTNSTTPTTHQILRLHNQSQPRPPPTSHQPRPHDDSYAVIATMRHNHNTPKPPHNQLLRHQSHSHHYRRPQPLVRRLQSPITTNQQHHHQLRRHIRYQPTT